MISIYTTMMIRTICLCLVGLPLLAEPPQASATPEVAEVPVSVREDLKLAPFYQKHIDLNGLSILSSEKVSDFALKEAAWIVGNMLSANPQIYKTLVKNGARIVVMAHRQAFFQAGAARSLHASAVTQAAARTVGGRRGGVARNSVEAIDHL